MFYTSSKANYTTNVFSLGSRVAAANFLWFTSSTLFFVSKASIMIYFLFFNFLSVNLIFASDRKRNNITNTTSILVLAIRKISSKSESLSYLSYREKLVTTMPKMIKVVPSIFWPLMLVFRFRKSNFSVYTRVIMLTSLLESIKASTNSFIHKTR